MLLGASKAINRTSIYAAWKALIGISLRNLTLRSFIDNETRNKEVCKLEIFKLFTGKNESKKNFSNGKIWN